MLVPQVNVDRITPPSQKCVISSSYFQNEVKNAQVVVTHPREPAQVSLGSDLQNPRIYVSVELPEFKSRLHHSGAVGSWARVLTSLSLSFLILNLRLYRAPAHGVVLRTGRDVVTPERHCSRAATQLLRGALPRPLGCAHAVASIWLPLPVLCGPQSYHSCRCSSAAQVPLELGLPRSSQSKEPTPCSLFPTAHNLDAIQYMHSV